MKKIITALKDFIEWIVSIYIKIRPKKTYWTIAVPLILFILGEIVKPISPLVKAIESYAKTVESKFWSKVLNFIAEYLNFDVPSWVLIIVGLIFITISTIKILDSRDNPKLKLLIKEIEDKKIRRDDLKKSLKSQVEKQLAKQINSGKYIPNIFIETHKNREYLRYFSHPILFYKKIYDSLERADYRLLNKKLAKQNTVFDIEVHKLNSKINIEEYIRRLNNWTSHLEGKLNTLKNLKISSTDRYSYESKISHRLEDIYYFKSKICLITENAGQGKTNFLCDYANRFLLGNEIPTIFLTGNEILPDNIRASILSKIFPERLNLSFKTFLDTTRDLCYELQKPLTIIIDGINENSNTKVFSKSLETFISDMQDYDYIKIIISCRKDYFEYNFKNIENSSFQNEISSISNLSLRRDDELQEKLFYAYFHHFNINFKEISGDVYNQLMSNFLLFRIFCETYKEQDIGIVKNIFKSELFQNYYNNKAEEINKKLNDNDEFEVQGDFDIRNFIRNIIKYMVSNNQYSNVPLDSIIEDERHRAIYVRFLDENILIKRDPKSDKSGIFGYSEVVNFTFDEFRDYLISSYLVEELYPKSSEQFDNFITNNINSESQILEGCGTFLFHTLRNDDTEELKNRVYNQEWFKGIFIKSIFNIKDEDIKDSDIERIGKYFIESDEYSFQIVNGLIRRYDLKIYPKLNIQFLFELIKKLEEDKFNKKFLNLFQFKSRNSFSRFYRKIDLEKIIEKLNKNFDNTEFINDSKYHNLFNLLIYLLPHNQAYRFSYLYERYAYKYIDKAHNQLKEITDNEDSQLKVIVIEFCQEYAIQL